MGGPTIGFTILIIASHQDTVILVPMKFPCLPVSPKCLQIWGIMDSFQDSGPPEGFTTTRFHYARLIIRFPHLHVLSIMALLVLAIFQRFTVKIMTSSFISSKSKICVEVKSRILLMTRSYIGWNCTCSFLWLATVKLNVDADRSIFELCGSLHTKTGDLLLICC